MLNRDSKCLEASSNFYITFSYRVIKMDWYKNGPLFYVLKSDR